MATPYRFLGRIDALPYNGVEPVFVLDTGAIIDLEEKDKIGLRAFLARSSTVAIAVPEVLAEIRRNHNTVIGQRRIIETSTLESLELLAERTRSIATAIAEHEQYDTHRYLAMETANEDCCEKKRRRDPISRADTHTIAVALTLAAHADELNLPGRYPVVLTSDEHLYRPITRLSNPLHDNHHDGYRCVIVLRTRP